MLLDNRSSEANVILNRVHGDPRYRQYDIAVFSMMTSLRMPLNRRINACRMRYIPSQRSLYHETFSTATLFLYRSLVLLLRNGGGFIGLQLTDVRIPEDKPLIQFILHPIHLATNDAEERFAVYQDFHSVLFHSLVERRSFIHVFQVVR